MFKDYVFAWRDGNQNKFLRFYFRTRKTRGGVMHQAWVNDEIPRLDDKTVCWRERLRNDVKLSRRMVYSIPSSKRVLERYCGQNCLRRLWDRLDALPFVDLGRACSWGNPFAWPDEPDMNELDDPDEMLETIKLKRKAKEEIQTE